MSRMFTKLPPTHSAPWLGIAVAWVIAAWAALSPDPVRPYEEMIGLDCDQDSVVEGQTYRSHVYREHDHGWWGETMKVFWSTQPGSATEHDYSPLHHKGQASNGFQTRVGRMGRTFYTTEDSYSEKPETFTISATNAFDESDEALTCPMEIQDDDGPGAYETRFDTVPGHGRGWYDSQYGLDQGRYRMNETIHIKLRFTEAVMAHGDDLTIGLHVGDQDAETANRVARFVSGSGSDTLTFKYWVGPEDLGLDGISVQDGEFGGHGHVYRAGTQDSVTGHIPGFSNAPGHQVDGRPRVASVGTTSDPASDGVYRAGETISVSLTFDRPVTVDGAPSIALEIGDHLVEATYRNGSGTDTVVFGYDMETHDRDDDGFALPARIAHGFGESGVYSSGGETAVDVEYGGFGDQDGHAVAGQAHVNQISMGSNLEHGHTYEPGDTIEVWVPFDDDLTVTGTAQLSLDLGGSTVLASFTGVGSLSQDGTGHSASQASGDVMMFSYTVQAGDIDSDGITIPRNGLSLQGGSILDSRGHEPDALHEAVTFANHHVGLVQPTLVSAQTSNDGGDVILTFSESVHVRSDLRTVSMFTGVDTATYPRALVDGHRAHTHDAGISDMELTLVMDSPIRSGQEVQVAYDDVFAKDLPGMLVDADGNPLEHFGPQGVTKNSTLIRDGDDLWPALSTYSLTITEGGVATYTVALGSQPDQEVTVSLSISPSGGLTASPASLTFTPDNWARRQTMELTAEADSDGLNGWHEVIHSADVAGFIVGHLKVLTVDE